MTQGTLSSVVIGLSCFLAAAPALAASDLRVTIPAPAPQLVYSPTSYGIVVANIGNQSASNVSLTVNLPATHTSPQVYVMGTLSAVDARCTRSGTKLTCALGTIAKNTSKTVTFNIALPEATEALTVSASATTTSSENSLANNAASDVAGQLNYSVDVQDGDYALIQHCTGTGLVSFFECELFPGAISSHEHLFHGDGTISFPDAPEYSGVWTQDSPDSLAFTYFEGDVPVAEFVGYGTTPSCFEGVTLFPGSTYVSPYEVCI